MTFKRLIVTIIHILVDLVAHVTSQMHPLQVVQKQLFVEEELLTEVTPRMW